MRIPGANPETSVADDLRERIAILQRDADEAGEYASRMLDKADETGDPTFEEKAAVASGRASGLLTAVSHLRQVLAGVES